VRVARRSADYETAPHGECPECGDAVPVSRHGALVDHYPDDVRHAYSRMEGYYCRGSQKVPNRIVTVEDRNAALTSEAEGKPVAVLTIEWAEGVTGEDVRRLARAWAKRLSEQNAAHAVHVRTYGTAERLPTTEGVR
jgi:hypothetical protein